MHKQTFWCHTRCEGESLFQSSYTSGGFYYEYSDSENSYNKKEQDSYRNQAVNCHNYKEENSATNCHRDKDTSEKNSKDEWKNASNSRNAAKSYQARNAADNCKRQ